MEIAAVWKSLGQDQRYLGALLLILLVSIAPLLVGRFYAVGDMRDVYIPLELFFQQELRAGRLPVWQPDVAWGFPVMAAGQIGFFYPPLLIGRWLLPIWIYLPLVMAGHLLAGSAGLYKYIRRLALSPGAAFIGALSFGLGAYWWQHLTQLNIFLAVAWLPWQMLSAYQLATGKSLSARRAAIFALQLGMPFLIGQIQIPVLMAAVATIYFLYLRAKHRQQWRRPLLAAFSIAVVVALIAAVQLLPTWQLVQQSSRGVDNDFAIDRANQHSYPLYHLPTLLFPRFYGTDDTYWGKRLEIEYGFFIGTLSLLLAIFAWIYGSVLKTKSATHHQLLTTTFKFMKWLALITFLLALGNLSPFRLIKIEPSLWIFSAPARWLLFTSLALSVLAAYGYELLAGQAELFARMVRRTGIVLAALVAGFNGVLLALTDARSEAVFALISRLVPSDLLSLPPAYYVEKVSLLLASARLASVSLLSPFTVLPMIIILALPWLLWRRHGRTILLALAVGELLLIAATTVPVTSWQKILSPPATVAALSNNITSGAARIYTIREGGDTGAFFTNPASRANATGRELQRQLLVPMISAQFGIPGVEWPAALDIAAHTRALNRLRHEEGYAIQEFALARHLNIGAVLAPRGLISLPEATSKKMSGPVDIYELNYSPRFEVLDEQGRALDARIEPQQTVPSQLRLIVDAPQAGQLLIRDTWFPGWQATVDGQTVSVVKTAGFFRGLSLPSGRHVVAMNYNASIVYSGALLTAMGLIVCLVVLTKSKSP